MYTVSWFANSLRGKIIMATNSDIVYKNILSTNYLKKIVADHRSFSSLMQRAPYDIVSVVATHQKRPIAFIFGIIEICCHELKNVVRERKRTKELYVEYIVVDDDFRKRGIGTELMKRFEAVAFELNIQKIRLFVEQTKQDARNLYAKRGFSVDGDNVGTLIPMAKNIRKK